MKYLETQEQFEELIGRVPTEKPLPPVSIVQFTATWCGACRRLDLPKLESQFSSLNWLKCDVDMNNYTPGFCGIRSIPTFLLIRDKVVVSTLQSSNTLQVSEWIQKNLGSGQ